MSSVSYSKQEEVRCAERRKGHGRHASHKHQDIKEYFLSPVFHTLTPLNPNGDEDDSYMQMQAAFALQPTSHEGSAPFNNCDGWRLSALLETVFLSSLKISNLIGPRHTVSS